MVMLWGREEREKEEEIEKKKKGRNEDQIRQKKKTHFKAVCQECLAKTHTHTQSFRSKNKI